MEIRSATLFADPTQPLEFLAPAADHVRQLLGAANLRLQTVRLATTPFPDWYQSPGQVDELVACCQAAGIDYLAIGPCRLSDDPSYLDLLPRLIGAHEVLFASAQIADQTTIDLHRARRVAELVQELAALRPDGFANLYFTATANCRPGSPFFPVAYHGHGPPRFAFATEAADLALTATRGASDLAEVRTNLVTAIEMAARELTRIAEQLAEKQGISFGGIDFSLAPYPEERRSLGAAMQALGVQPGAQGGLLAAAFLAEAVDRARFPACGFSGLMFPVLEDAILARRAADSLLSVSELLLYSAVCGAGLDTIPLPGAIEHDEVVAILLDVAALAVRLDKPLTARLMPLPGLSAGDPVTFDFPYFAASCVMAVESQSLVGTLDKTAQIEILSRTSAHRRRHLRGAARRS